MQRTPNGTHAPADRPANASASPWGTVLGHPPLVLHAAERRDRGGRVLVTWVDPTAPPDAPPRERLLDIGVRDAAGAVDRAAVTLAHMRLKRLYLTLMAGRDPDAPGAPAPFSLAAGFGLALAADGSGLYAPDTPEWREATRAAGMAAQVLGPDTGWTVLVPLRVDAVRRALTAGRVGRDRRDMAATAETVVSVVYAVAAWLRDRERIPPGACLAPTP